MLGALSSVTLRVSSIFLTVQPYTPNPERCSGTQRFIRERPPEEDCHDRIDVGREASLGRSDPLREGKKWHFPDTADHNRKICYDAEKGRGPDDSTCRLTERDAYRMENDPPE